MKKIVNFTSIILLTALSIAIMWHEASLGFSGVNSVKRLALIPALFFAQYNKYTLKVAFGLLVLYAFYTVVALTYGLLRITFLISALETNTNEGLEFFHTLPLLNYFVGLAFLLLAVVYYKTATLYKASHKFYATGAIILFIAGMSSAWPGYLVRKSISLGKQYYEGRQALIESLSKPDSWQVQPTPNYHKYDNYVLIIGESVRKDYLSVYGYPHPTTPWLDKANGTFVDGYISMGYNTVSSLSRTLTQSIGNGMAFIPENNIITLANKGGYDTYWISNQGQVGKHDTSTSTVAVKAKQSIFMNKGSFSDTNIDDDKMLVHMEDILSAKSDKPRLIVIHMLGSHPYACSRLHGFPVNFHLGQGETLDCYLASLEKTDNFFKQVTQKLAQHGSYSMIYFSDHGMSVEADMVNVEGKIRDAYEVPFIVLNSDDTAHNLVKKTISGFYFTDIFANWLGLNTGENSQRYDITHIENMPEPKQTLSFYSDEMIDPMQLPEQAVLQ